LQAWKGQAAQARPPERRRVPRTIQRCNGSARPGVLKWLYRSSGAILVGLGLKLAFERRP